MAVLKICRNCGTQTYGRYPGSSLITLLLLCMFILPGLIYSQWRGSKGRIVCPKCKAEALVPLDSPFAAQMHTSQPVPGHTTGQAHPGFTAPAAKTKELSPLVRNGLIIGAVLIFAVIMHGKGTDQMAANRILSACRAISLTTALRSCDADQTKKLVSVLIKTDKDKADKTCLDIAEKLRKARPGIENGWQLQIQSPSGYGETLATCPL